MMLSSIIVWNLAIYFSFVFNELPKEVSIFKRVKGGAQR